MREFYVYGWFCEDWGHVPFYVGKGKGSRYKSKADRGVQFSSIINSFKCYPQLLATDLSESQALRVEGEIKLRFAKSGFPVIDMENGALKKSIQKEGIASAKKRGVKFGRPKKDVSDFRRLYVKVINGKITVKEACEELNISRTQWYRLVKKVS